MAVHPTAVIEDGAELDDSVEVGPYAVIGAGVVLGEGVRVGAHCVVEGPTVVGPRTLLSPHVVLGGSPQDRRHDVEVTTRLEIGADNVFREFSSAHRGSSGGDGVTRVGDRNYFMANSHVAHDCVIGSDVMFANSAAIAGHVQVGDGAVLGGLCAAHQFSRIGRLSMVGGGAMCAQDVPPFSIAQGDRARLYGVNIIGLRRGGMSSQTIGVIKEAWRELFVGDLPRRTAMSRVEDSLGEHAEVQELLTFLRSSTRGLCRAAVQA